MSFFRHLTCNSGVHTIVHFRNQPFMDVCHISDPWDVCVLSRFHRWWSGENDADFEDDDDVPPLM